MKDLIKVVFYFFIIAYLKPFTSANANEPLNNLVLNSNEVGSSNRIHGTNGESYGISGQEVYKLDSGGNTVWVRVFSQPLNPMSTHNNVLSHITRNGDRVFIFANQGPGMNQGLHFPTVIVLDTAGVLLNIAFQAGGFSNFRPKACFNSANGGVFCMYETGGSNSLLSIIRTDVNGDPDALSTSLTVFWFSTLFSELLYSEVDSSYLIIFNSTDYNPGTLLGAFALIKMSTNGSIIWIKSYYYNPPSGFTATLHHSSTIDESGNIYLNAYYFLSYPTYYEGLMVGKLNPEGDVMFTKCWTQLPLRDYKFFNMKIIQDSIYVDTGPDSSPVASVSMKFDTLFNHSCISPDSTVQLNSNFLSVTHSPQYCCYGSATYSPVIGSGNYSIPSPVLYPDICNILDIEKVSTADEIEDPINLHPNPGSGLINISTNVKEVIHIIEMYDIKGSLVLSEQASDCISCSLDLSLVQSGIYFIKILTERRSYIKKFVVR